MRDIKFRAWDKKDNRMITDLFGFAIDINKERFRYFRKESNMPDGMATKVVDLSDIELMQYTGLKDKNGVEIYEGDIGRRLIDGDNRFNLKHIYYDYWLIEWLDKTSGFTTTCIGESKNDKYIRKEPKQNSYSTRFNEIEVIGNIFENKDLL